MDVYEIITEKIIEKLESGVIPWRKPWRQIGGHHIPRNGVTRRAYSGMNLWLLNNYDSPDFFTARQIRELGGTIQKGEKGNIVTFWNLMKFNDPTGEPDPDTGDCIKTVPFLRYYQVWNRTQCTGLPKPQPEPTPEPPDPIAAAEALIAGYRDRPEIREGEPRAYYAPMEDYINMPIRGSFENAESFYSTLFHELTHSTGHPARLGRLEKCKYHYNDDRSREELCAEMGASYLCGIAGIDQATLDNSAAYISSWLRVFRGDKRFLVEAAGAAQKAVDYMLGRRGDQAEDSETRKSAPKGKRAAKKQKLKSLEAEQLTFSF